MKNQIRFFTLLLCTFFSISAYAQIDLKHFPIDSFRLPDVRWKGLDLGGSIANSIRNNKAIEDLPTSFSFNSELSAYYFEYVSRRDLQRSMSVSSSPIFQIYSGYGGNIFINSPSRYFHPDIRLNWQRAKYKGLSFFQTGLIANASYSRSYDETFSIQNQTKFITRRSTINGSLSLPIGFGKGRIEPVSNVSLALFLLKDALDLGLDPQTITYDKVLGFAGLMSELQYKRIFDTRAKRIFNLRTLYDYMLDNGLTLPNDPGFFTVLVDNWLYSFSNTRYAGKKWTYLVTPIFEPFDDAEYTNNGTNAENRNQSIKGVVSIQYEKYKPINLHKDFIRMHKLSANLSRYRLNLNEENLKYKSWEALLENQIGYGWFPNSRTYLYANLNVDIGVGSLFESPNEDTPLKYHVFDFSLSGNSSYYLSPGARLNLNASLGYFDDNGDVNGIGPDVLFHTPIRGFVTSLNVSIQVSLF